MKTVAVTQSNYIPWRGYFDIIQACDAVILLDDVQFTRRDWRNRNKIKTESGAKWLTIPVDNKGKYASQRICETTISDHGEWTTSHFNQIKSAYKKSPYFKDVTDVLAPLYEKAQTINLLSHINILFLKAICEYINIRTPLTFSTNYFSLDELDAFSSTERLLRLCQKEQASHYISGPAAQSYMDCSLFEKANIQIQWADYSNYPPYPQLHGEFDPAVSILDLMFNVSQKEISTYMKKIV